MRVLQLIDSLNPGGAERVAVSYANSLISSIEESFLCATREEGLLKQNLKKEVSYFFLDKKSTIDLKAIKVLNRFIKSNKINIVHAHASSFFLATIVKMLNPSLALIWHEHYGNRAKAPIINRTILKGCSQFFSAVIVVNKSLKERSEKKLLNKKVYFLGNYPTINSNLKTTFLNGEPNKRIVCLANFRPDKDHINLLKAFAMVVKSFPDWTLHLVGKYYDDDYFYHIDNFIKESNLSNHIFIYGSCLDTINILNQSSIGVLSSKSEGLPMALLEYGLCGLPVVATNVGDCKEVISNCREGQLVSPENASELAKSILKFIKDDKLRNENGKNLRKKVQLHFSENKVKESLLNIYKEH